MVLALRGTDGHELWRIMTYSGVTDLECDMLDVNSDGRKDCIVTGKMGTVMAIDTRNGRLMRLYYDRQSYVARAVLIACH